MHVGLYSVGTYFFRRYNSQLETPSPKETHRSFSSHRFVTGPAMIPTRRAWPVLQGLRWHLVQFGYVQYSTYNVTPSSSGGDKTIRRDLAVYGARDVEKV